MLGTDLLVALQGREVTAVRRADLDVTDLDAVRAAVAGHDVVLNAAAFTNVDLAETEEAEAHRVNAIGAGNLATAAAESGARLVQYSTDYVFDGTAHVPYAEGAPTRPVTAYGRTKAEGERLALEGNPGRTYVLRTAFLYGQHGSNFAATMVALAGKHPTVSVVTDQVGQPTWTVDVAAKTVELLDSGAAGGIFHATSSGQASWFDFAGAIFDETGLGRDRVLPTDSVSFVRPAPRPAYSVLGHDRWAEVGLAPIRDWRSALHDAVSHGAVAASP